MLINLNTICLFFSGLFLTCIGHDARIAPSSSKKNVSKITAHIIFI